MTSFYYSNTPDKMGYARALEKTHEAGFDAIDFCMCPMQRNETELNLDDWRETLEKIVAVKEKLGLDIAQSHLPYPKIAGRRSSNTDPGCEMNEYFREMTRRSVEISGALGVKWAVVHPVEYENVADELCPEKNAAYNLKIYGPIFEQAKKLGVGLAFENMADADGRRFGSTPEDLLRIVEAFNDPMVQVCWDFGHGNRVFKNQTEQIKKIGKYLKATHVDDNLGKDDLHTVPFLGNVNWPGIMKCLREIGYEECFNYEVSLRKVPAELVDVYVKYVYETGRYLLKL